MDPRDRLNDNKVWWGLFLFGLLLLFFVSQYDKLIN